MIYDTEGTPEFNHTVREWFRRRLLQSFEHWAKPTETRNSTFWEAFRDPKAREYMIEECERRIHEFVHWQEGDEYEPDVERDFGKWQYDHGAVSNVVVAIALDALEFAAHARDAESYTTLDDWLQADRDGELEGAAPDEPSADKLRGTGCKMESAADCRRARWPRSCKTCGAEFQGEGKECEPCQVRRLQARKSWHKPTPCRGCGEEFMPNTWNAAYCSHECHQNYLERKRQGAQ
ncbi:MAG: hypothetical protein IH965_13530 [Gemmatimonadetes bacterium]|nr:hypothetical protein [Gemmatimonadota bacterium]